LAGFDSCSLEWRLLRALAARQVPFWSLSGRTALWDMPDAWEGFLVRLELVWRSTIDFETVGPMLRRLYRGLGLRVIDVGSGPRELMIAVMDGFQTCEVRVRAEGPPLEPPTRTVIGGIAFHVESPRDVLAGAFRDLSNRSSLWDLRTAHLAFAQGCDLQTVFEDLPKKAPDFSPIELLWRLDHIEIPGDDPDTARTPAVLDEVKHFGRDLYNHIFEAISQDLRVS
jgi:hypothetical protein